MLELKFIQPAELWRVWDYVRGGLEKVKKFGPDGWLVEDVYASIKAGAANLHIGIRDSYQRGFIVTAAQNGFKGPVLHIWACYIDSKDDEIAEFWDTFFDMAKKAGFVRMTFHSPRKGWEKRLEKYGFTPEQVIFSKEV